MKDNLGRSDVAFARNGFAEGAPKRPTCRDEVARRALQTQLGSKRCFDEGESPGGAIVLMFGLDPRLRCSQHQPQTHAGSRWRHPRQCRRCPRPR